MNILLYHKSRGWPKRGDLTDISAKKIHCWPHVLYLILKTETLHRCCGGWFSRRQASSSSCFWCSRILWRCCTWLRAALRFNMTWGQQCSLFSRNIVYVTPQIIYFHHMKNIFSGSKHPKNILFNFENRSTVQVLWRLILAPAVVLVIVYLLFTYPATVLYVAASALAFAQDLRPAVQLI